MRVVMVEPRKAAYEAEIANSLEAMQEVVGGTIQMTYPYKDLVALICNDEGKLEGLPLNRALRDENGAIYDVIAGNFFVAGIDDETYDLTSMSDDLIKKYLKLFQQWELFYV